MSENQTLKSQSAFVRGFIDDVNGDWWSRMSRDPSQSAFVRGFIDDSKTDSPRRPKARVSIRVRARLHR